MNIIHIERKYVIIPPAIPDVSMKNCNFSQNLEAITSQLQAGSTLFCLDVPVEKRTVSLVAKLQSLGIEFHLLPVATRSLLTSLDTHYRLDNRASILHSLMTYFNAGNPEFLGTIIRMVAEDLPTHPTLSSSTIFLLQVSMLWYSLLSEAEQVIALDFAVLAHGLNCSACSTENSLFGYPPRVKTLTKILYGEVEHSTLGILQ